MLRARSVLRALFAITPVVAACDCGDVAAPVAVALRVEPERLDLRPLDTATLEVLATFDDGHEEDVSSIARIESSAPSVASGGEGSKVLALGPGSATLTVTAIGLSATVPVEVVRRDLVDLTVLPVTAAVPSGGELTFELFGRYSDGVVRDVSAEATWTSLDANVAGTNGPRITGIADGHAVIRAELDGKSAYAELRVGPNVFSSSPADGEVDVAVTRETVLTFDYPLAENVVPTGADVFASAGGSRLAGRLHLSRDRRRLTLFYAEPLPGSTRVSVTVTGDALLDERGRALDADGDGVPGGTTLLAFDTLSVTLVPGTAVFGRVFASELDASGGGSVNVPLEGVTITIDGIDPGVASARTDAMGNFRLEPAPAGRFFVHVDGRTASGSGNGAYYPFVGKPWTSVAEVATSVGDVYLPRVPPDALTEVSPDGPTTIAIPPSLLAEHPELDGVTVTVPGGALYADDGTVGGRVGIAPVPPDRIPGKLPPSLPFSLVITVQTDGATNFDEPIAACFPNLPHPITGEVLPPGAITSLLSFDHDKGDFDFAAAAQITPDGRLACTRPREGIRAPGWHAVDRDTPHRYRRPKKDGDRPRPMRGAMPMEDMMCRMRPPLSFFAVASATASCLSLFTGLSGNMQRFLTFMSDVQQLASRVGDLVLAYRENRLDAQLVLIGIQELIAAKPGLIAFFAELQGTANPLSRVSNAVGCANDVLAIFEPKCMAIVECDMSSALLRGACEALITVRAYLDQAQTVLSYLQTLLTSAPFVPVCAALDGASSLAQQEVDRANALSPAQAQSLDMALTELEATLEPFEDVPMLDLEAALLEMEQVVQDLGDGEADVYGAPPHAFVLESHEGFEQRIQADASGSYQVFIPSGVHYTIAVLDPATLRCGVTIGRSPVGAPGAVSGAALGDCGDADADDDGVSDDGERIVGTSSVTADTDGDGVGDGAELVQGTDPLDGIPVRVGILATADTPDLAVDVCASESLVAVADTTSLRVFNTYSGMAPILVGVVEERVRRVACDGTRVVGIGDVTVLWDVADRARAPRVLPIRGGAVDLRQDTVLLGTGGGMVAVGFESGMTVASQRASAGVAALAMRDDLVYVLGESAFDVFRYSGGGFTFAGGTTDLGPTAPPSGRRLFVGLAEAYGVHLNGFDRWDLTVPAAPVTARGDTGFFGWRHLVADGAGRAVAAAGLDSTDGQDVWLHSLADPTASGRLAVIPTPGDTFATIVHEGLVYAADGTAGLQVVNYLARDLGRTPPSIQLEASATTVEEGKSAYLLARASDDVLVRTVELYADGVAVANDGSFPFRFELPVAPPARDIEVRARAIDTGGNASWSAPSIITVVPDATPPSIAGAVPAGATTSTSVVQITVTFDEAMDLGIEPNAALDIVEAGTDGMLGTADDAGLTGWTAGLANVTDRGVLVIMLLQPLAEGAYRVSLGAPLRDLATIELVATSFDIVVGNAQAISGPVSLTYTTGAAAESTDPWIDPTGRWIGYDSSSDELDPTDTNGVRDVFLFDAATQSSMSFDTLDVWSRLRGMSADRSLVLFEAFSLGPIPDTNAHNDAFLLDVGAGTFERVSLDVAGAELTFGSGPSMISDDGRYLAYEATNNLGFGGEVIRLDRVTGARTVTAITPSGNPPTNGAQLLAIANSGEVALRIDAEAYVRDPDLGVTVPLVLDLNGVQQPWSNAFDWSGDGLHLAYAIGTRLYVRDRGVAAGTVLYDAGASIQHVAISDDGQRVLHVRNDELWLADRTSSTQVPVLWDPTTSLTIYRIVFSGDGTTAAVEAAAGKSSAVVYRVVLP